MTQFQKSFPWKFSYQNKIFLTLRKHVINFYHKIEKYLSGANIIIHVWYNR